MVKQFCLAEIGSSGKFFADFVKQNAGRSTQDAVEDQKLIYRRVRGGTQSTKKNDWEESVIPGLDPESRKSVTLKAA